MTILEEIRRLTALVESGDPLDKRQLKQRIEALRRSLLSVRSRLYQGDPTVEKWCITRAETSSIANSLEMRRQDAREAYKILVESGGFTKPRPVDAFHANRHPEDIIALTRVPASILEALRREPVPPSFVITLNIIRSLAKVCGLEAMVDSESHTFELDKEDSYENPPGSLIVSLGAKAVVLDFHIDTATGGISSMKYTNAYEDKSANAHLAERAFQSICNRLFPFSVDAHALAQSSPYSAFLAVYAAKDNLTALVDFQRAIFNLSVLDSASDETQSDCVDAAMALLYQLASSLASENVVLPSLLLGELVLHLIEGNERLACLVVAPIFSSRDPVLSVKLDPPLHIGADNAQAISNALGGVLLGASNVTPEGFEFTRTTISPASLPGLVRVILASYKSNRVDSMDIE